MRVLSRLFFILLAVATLTHPTAISQEGAFAGFARENRDALNKNPAGLQVELRTHGGQTTFHLYETIPIEIAFSSSRQLAYSIEMNETMNPAGQANWLNIEPRESVLRTGTMWFTHAFSCCASRRVYLASNPIVLHRELNDFLRFKKPGQYQLYFTTSRIFRGEVVHRPTQDFKQSTFSVVSNILSTVILPDDPKWDAARLAGTLSLLQDPQVRAAYEKMEKTIHRMPSELDSDTARTNELSQTEFVRAQKALNALDTPEAIQERINRMTLESISDWQSDKGTDSRRVFYQPYLDSTTRPDLIVAAMSAKAAVSSFGVDYGYASAWSRFLVQRNHPEIFAIDIGETGQSHEWQEFNAYQALEEGGEIIGALEACIEKKSGTAREMTADTIRLLKDDYARWSAPPKKHTETHPD
jgi:hypothetical protein